MHLLQSNVDLNMIRSWMGHASIETTNGYVEIDLEMKPKTLKAAEKLIPKPAKRGRSWQKSPDILSWLSELSLCAVRQQGHTSFVGALAIFGASTPHNPASHIT